jgi:hypothetical protein
MLFVFFINLIISTVYIALMGNHYAKYKLPNRVLFTLMSPIFFLWILICGGQYDVGTDYFSYLEIFNGETSTIYRHGEYLFHYIVVFCNYIGLKGQSLFFVFYGIGFLFLFSVLKRLEIRYIFIYIILYITMSNLFNNQLNILRQSMAIYIGTYGTILYLENKKIHSIIVVFFASLMHTSALIFLVIHFVFSFYTTQKTIYFLMLMLSFIIGFLFKIEWVDLLLNVDFLPPHYLYHIQSGRIEYSLISRLLTKYIFIPFYLLSIIQCVGKNSLTKIETHLFFIGFLSFCLRLIMVNLLLLSRISDSFLLLSIFPIYFYFRETLKKRYYAIFSICILILFTMYFLKTIIFSTPGKEYFYRSIYL